MRKGILLLSLLLLASILQAANITEFTTPYLYNWENYSRDVRVVNINIPSGNYSVVVINNTSTFLLNLTDNISFVGSQQQINSILREYYTISTFPTNAELNALNSSFESFLSSRGSNELDCRVITGLATPDGSPHLTCTAENNCRSCRSVPVCKDYMDHTVTSPDPMSSPVAKAVVGMSIDFNVIHTNVTSFKSNMEELREEIEELSEGRINTANVSLMLITIKQNINSVTDAVDDLGKSPVANIYEQYSVTHSSTALDFCKNFYQPYNLTALNSALSKATELSSRIPTESTITEQIASIVNKTPERKANRTIREEHEAFEASYAVLLARRNNIRDRADAVLSHISDNETAKQLTALDDVLTDVHELGEARDYGGADLLSRNFSQTANSLDLRISGINTSYDELVNSNGSASDALFEAWLYVESEDFVTEERLDSLTTQKASVEFTMYNASPLTIAQANQLNDELTGIKLNANAIRDEKASASSQQMNNLIAIIAKPGVSISLNIIDSFMPLSYADKEKNASTIIGVLLALADILILVIVLGAFFYFVRSRKIELHKVAKISWAFIFAFFVLVLALGSLAIHNVADMQSHPTTFGPFISEFRSSAKAGIVADLTGLNGTMRESMSNCSAKIALKMASLQKTVMHYEFDGDSCSGDNNTMSLSSCQNALDAHPVIILRSGEQPKATFNVFYMKKAVLEGDENFFKECTMSKVLS